MCRAFALFSEGICLLAVDDVPVGDLRGVSQYLQNVRIRVTHEVLVQSVELEAKSTSLCSHESRTRIPPLTSFISSGLISKSKMLAFETMRLGETDLGMTTKPLMRNQPSRLDNEGLGGYAHMLETPSEHDLRLVLVVCLGDLLHDRVIEPHCPGQGSPGLDEHLVSFSLPKC